ncbi:MAG: hypothetical protein ACPGMR_05065 [Pontibacterium sp.]
MSNSLSKHIGINAFVLPDAVLKSVETKAAFDVAEHTKEPLFSGALGHFDASQFKGSLQGLWDLVCDDLRAKVVGRSLNYFSDCLHQATYASKPLRCFEDLETSISEEQLIVGAYFSGVIGWEAQRLLRNLEREVRDAPFSHKTQSPLPQRFHRVCEQGVDALRAAAAPAPLIEVEEYVGALSSPRFHRNMARVDAELADMPSHYLSLIAHKLYGLYIKASSSRTLRANIDCVAPILWGLLRQSVRIPINHLIQSDATWSHLAERFFRLVTVATVVPKPLPSEYLSQLIQNVVSPYGQAQADTCCESERLMQVCALKALVPHIRQVPEGCLQNLVLAAMHLYLSASQRSSGHSRFNCSAVVFIPGLLRALSFRATRPFVQALVNDEVLRYQILSPVLLRRLRVLSQQIELRHSQGMFAGSLIRALRNEREEPAFFALLEERRGDK